MQRGRGGQQAQGRRLGQRRAAVACHQCQGQRSYVPDQAPRAAFASTREQAKQAAQLGQQRPNDGWNSIEGEAGWIYIGP